MRLMDSIWKCCVRCIDRGTERYDGLAIPKVEYCMKMPYWQWFSLYILGMWSGNGIKSSILSRLESDAKYEMRTENTKETRRKRLKVGEQYRRNRLGEERRKRSGRKRQRERERRHGKKRSEWEENKKRTKNRNKKKGETKEEREANCREIDANSKKYFFSLTPIGRLAVCSCIHSNHFTARRKSLITGYEWD